MELLSEQFGRELPRLDPSDQNYVPQLVSAILAGARRARATDVHLIPSADELEMRWRIDVAL